MTGILRHLKASLGLVLLTGLVAGCATTPPWAPVTPEAIPAQVCSAGGDSDADGITDCNDLCANTPRDRQVGSDGCPLPEPAKPYRN